jgi:hypothetical protein
MENDVSSGESQPNQQLVLVFMPSLVATLMNREEAKGSPLTEAEVLGIRNQAPVVAVPASVAEAVTRERGYADIDPEHLWVAWQAARAELSGI